MRIQRRPRAVPVVVILGVFVGVLGVLLVILLLAYAGLSAELKKMERSVNELQTFGALLVLSEELGPAIQRAKDKQASAVAAGGH